MSTTKTNVHGISGSRTAVLARAFRGEPAKLWAVADLGEVVEVTGEHSASSIGWPAAAVYRFDDELFEKLKAAFDHGDRRQLESLWKEAKGFRD